MGATLAQKQNPAARHQYPSAQAGRWASAVVPVLALQQGASKSAHMFGLVQLVVVSHGQEPTDHSAAYGLHVNNSLHTTPPFNYTYSLYRFLGLRIESALGVVKLKNYFQKTQVL
jgi:hypothetical protein